MPKRSQGSQVKSRLSPAALPAVAIAEAAPAAAPQRRRYEWLILAGLSVILLLQLWTSIRRLSVTYDEVDHLHAGYRYLQCGDFGWNPEHPPLAKMVAALPLSFMAINDPIIGACGMPNSKHLDFEKGHEFVLANSGAVVFAARAAMSVFALALLILVWFAARKMFGFGVAVIAGTLLVFEPNFLGHGALVTTDVPASVGIFAAVFAFWAYVQKRTKSCLLLLGLATGGALALKHSTLMLALILLALAIADPLVRRTRMAGRQITRNVGALAVVAVIAIAVLWTAYGWRYAARPMGTIWKNAALQHTEGALPNRMVPAAQEAHILPEAYLTGLQDVLVSSEIGRPFFLLGKVYRDARWFGFPVAIAMKSTLVVLLFSLLACVAVKLWRERCRELLFLTLPPAFYLAISLNSGLGNGIRHILPVLPFCVVFAAAGVWSLAANRRSWKVVLGAAIALHALSSLRAFPNYISYGNELWGGPENTYAYLADANVDWGQGLKMAKSYVKRTHSQPCWIVQISWVPDYEIPCGESSPTRHEIPPVHFKGTLIVSSWEVSGMGTGSVRAMEIFRGRKPVATLAGSAMLVYEGEFDLSPIAAAEHFNLAQMARDPARTVSELELAAALDPGYAAPHLQLCSLAGQRGDMERAERECNVALDLSRKDPTTPSATTRSLARFMQRRGIRIRARDVAENSTGQ